MICQYIWQEVIIQELPIIGASGGISGIIAFYCLSFPKVKVGLLLHYRWFRIPVGWMFAIWVGMQFGGAMNQVSGFGDVSHLAHLGGVIIGVAFWVKYSDLLKETSESIVSSNGLLCNVQPIKLQGSKGSMS